MPDARIKDWMEAWKTEVANVAVWKKEALRHCNRADKAEAEVERLRALLTDGGES